MKNLFYYFKIFLLLPFRFIEYYLDGLLFDPFKLRSCDFSGNFKSFTNVAADGKIYSIFNPEYWNQQWIYWKESKKIGKKYYQDVADLVKRNSKRVFEIGCGPGYLIELFSPQLIYHGIDISSESIKMARDKLPNRKNFQLSCDTIKNFQFYLEKGRFDTLIAVDFIEHLEDELFFEVVKAIKKYDFKFFFLFVLILTEYQVQGILGVFQKLK